MKNKNLKYILIAFFVFFLFLNFSGVDAKVSINEQTNALAGSAGFSTSGSIADVVSVVIKAFFSLLGIIFVSLLVYAGYNWMTASGEEEKVKKAQDTIRRAIIGLVITVSAYAITYFVFTQLPKMEGSNTSGSSDITGSP